MLLLIMMKNIKLKKALILALLFAILVCGAFLFVLVKKQQNIQPEEDPEPVCELVEHNKIYLAIDEKYKLDDVGYISQNESVAIVDGDIVKGVSNGVVSLVKDCNSYEIEVTDMITAPYVSTKKQQLPCGRYSQEENEYLDKVLASKVNNVGYHTRAGAVEAARFLLLQFPYHMSYFSENGRYYGDAPLCEGEGRYYHEGLYLNTYKVEKDGFVQIVNGPAEWGCRIYSNPGQCYQLNSLDCSGFVTWCLVNGGWDPGDLGAGPIDDVYEYSDIGEQHEITLESLDEVKVGDLFAEEGHIAILIGIENETYYIAESNLGIDIQVRVSSKQELVNSKFYAWIDMDEFYEHKDGKLTNYWQE